MAEPKQGEKTLEMRVAELEDKLKGMQVTEEEMRAYQKVASLIGAAPQAGVAAAAQVAGPTTVPADCVVSQCVRACTVVSQCIRSCTVVSQCIRSCTVVSQCIRACTIIQDCINECGGGGGGFGGGGGRSGGGGASGSW
jgi:uncharacterized membrane protein YgcG